MQTMKKILHNAVSTLGGILILLLFIPFGICTFIISLTLEITNTLLNRLKTTPPG